VSEEIVIVAGLGEVGRPLLSILQRTYGCVGIDVQHVHVDRPCSVLHVCYPFQMPDFVGTTAAYVARFRPKLTIINSTVAVSTTRKVQERVATPVAYSPVRGKHAKMEQDMLHYQKFVGGMDSASTHLASQHFAGAGFKVATFPTPEAGEVAKLLETTWLGMLVGWAQDIERMAAHCGASYEDVNAFFKEIDYLPKNVFPGYIGGHCVMPNIAILRKEFTSRFLDAIVESNDAKEKDLLVTAGQSQKAKV
jgi:UDP-N-acetyl-D-mannosaminuronate dehydrogenase